MTSILKRVSQRPVPLSIRRGEIGPGVLKVLFVMLPAGKGVVREPMDEDDVELGVFRLGDRMQDAQVSAPSSRSGFEING